MMLLLLLPAVDRETMAHCAAAAAIVAATSELIASESRAFDDLAHDMIDVATAFVISATAVVLTASRGLKKKNKFKKKILLIFTILNFSTFVIHNFVIYY